MDRRSFLKIAGTGALGASLHACAHGMRLDPAAIPRRRLVNLVPVDASWDRIIRTTVGLRPYRASGFVLRAERFDDKALIHNYGHGGAGMSLGWGTAAMAADLALEHPDRTAAVLGCGIAGLTTARQLQRRGFAVTIYAAELPPYTTSNMSWATFTPTSGLVATRGRTPEWDTQFRSAVAIAYREHQLLVGRNYGVSWMDEYSMTNNESVVQRERELAAERAAARANNADLDFDTLLPPDMDLPREMLLEGEHPFGSRYARRFPTLRFEPTILLDALMRDVIAFGGRLVVRRFDTARDIAGLAENVVVNCTGLGSKSLFSDDELTPVKGQLVVLVPQPEVTYATSNMLPRSDGIALGHVMLQGDSSLDVDEEAQRRVVESAIAFFGSMRMPERAPSNAGSRNDEVPLATVLPPATVPPVESFFGRIS